MRVFTVVGRPARRITPAVEAPEARRRAIILSPDPSRPTIPTDRQRTPSPPSRAATLPAPPGRSSSRSTRTTWTGASGETRPTAPKR